MEDIKFILFILLIVFGIVSMHLIDPCPKNDPNCKSGAVTQDFECDPVGLGR